MKLKATQIRKGMILIYNGELNVVTGMQHFTPGKGQAGVQVKMKNIKTGNKEPENLKKEKNKMTDENKNDAKANFIAMKAMFGAEKASEYFEKDLSMEDAMKDFIEVQNQNIKDLSDANDAHVKEIENLNGEKKTLEAKVNKLEEGSDSLPKAGNLSALDDKIKDELDNPEGEDTETFMDKVQQIQDAKKCSRTEAMREASNKFPELHEAYKNGEKKEDD